MLRWCCAFVVTAVALTATAYADTFQLLHKSGQATYRVANARIVVFDSEDDARFEGYTDRQGRVLLTLPNGIYTARVVYRQATWCVTMRVTGDREVRDLMLASCR